MKPTKKQLSTFPSVVNLTDDTGEILGQIPGNVLWEYMVEKGYKKMNEREIHKAANDFIVECLDLLKTPKKKTKTKKAAPKTSKNKKSTKK